MSGQITRRVSKCFYPMFIILVSVVFAKCYYPEPKDAKHFIEQYSLVWDQGKVDRIMYLTADVTLLDFTNASPDLKQAMREYSVAKQREEVEEDIKNKGFGSHSWPNTKYSSEKDFPDHIVVDVTVDYAHSEVVLVKQNGKLKLCPFPHLYDEQ